MSTSRRRPALLAIALVAVACGGSQQAATPTLDGDVGATVSAIEDDETSTEAAATPSDDESAGEATPDTAPTTDEPATDEPVDDEPADDEPVDDEPVDDEPADDDGTCSVAADEAAIEVARPAPGATVDRTIRLAGCGNTFEATYLWEVELDDGTMAGSGFGTMTCGTGCVGTFDDEVEATGSGDATLRVFEEDAADGGRINVVEVPITIAP